MAKDGSVPAATIAPPAGPGNEDEAELQGSLTSGREMSGQPRPGWQALRVPGERGVMPACLAGDPAPARAGLSRGRWKWPRERWDGRGGGGHQRHAGSQLWWSTDCVLVDVCHLPPYPARGLLQLQGR